MMSVQELIEALEAVGDKEQIVVFDDGFSNASYSIDEVIEANGFLTLVSEN